MGKSTNDADKQRRTSLVLVDIAPRPGKGIVRSSEKIPARLVVHRIKAPSLFLAACYASSVTSVALAELGSPPTSGKEGLSRDKSSSSLLFWVRNSVHVGETKPQVTWPSQYLRLCTVVA